MCRQESGEQDTPGRPLKRKQPHKAPCRSFINDKDSLTQMPMADLINRKAPTDKSLKARFIASCP
jgi:hypothetical protein